LTAHIVVPALNRTMTSLCSSLVEGASTLAARNQVAGAKVPLTRFGSADAHHLPACSGIALTLTARTVYSVVPRYRGTLTVEK
jgi:hypothetical protein